MRPQVRCPASSLIRVRPGLLPGAADMKGLVIREPLPRVEMIDAYISGTYC